MISRVRKDYPQINYVDDKGIQWIEINRGCKRQCEFCWADPNYKVFPVPKIVSNKVQIIGENILYDPDIKDKLIELGNKRVNNKVVYYAICNGVDYRLLTDKIIEMLSSYRFGKITKKRQLWKKGVSIAWDLGKEQEKDIKQLITKLEKFKFIRKHIMIHVLVNWKIPLDVCEYKQSLLYDLGVMIDDCTWECTKRNFLPMYWTVKEYKSFRRKCRIHNIKIPRNGYYSKENPTPKSYN